MYTNRWIKQSLIPLGIQYSHRMIRSSSLTERLQGIALSIKNSSIDKTSQNIFFMPEKFHPLKKQSIKILETEIASSLEKISHGIRKEAKDESLKAFGDKHRNLVLMKQLFLSIGRSDVEIPSLQGISSDQVLLFLGKRAPELFTEWEKLQRMNLSLKSFREDPCVKEMLEKIEASIKRAFSSDQAFEELNLEEMEEYLQKQQASNSFLMVRSTGTEDSSLVSNAGGNVSCSYVLPNKSSLCEAMGEVVSSYFSRNSLQIRLNAGVNPFQESLKVAVSVQELIGESVGGSSNLNDIPISFVLFTNEPIYVGKEKFRVMQISATYGHGEGVVNSQGILTDTALVLVSEAEPDRLYYFYENKKKSERKVALKLEDQIVLGNVANPEELVRRRALNEDQILALYSSGVLVESFFGSTPTDIEGVIRGDKIYFVQARPLNQKMVIPTYLKKNGIETIQSEPITMGTASVLEIADFKEILFALTLEESQKLFDSSQHKLVIVKQSETSMNSHAVVNFKGLGVPSLVVPEDLQTFLKDLSAQYPLVVDMQTGKLHRWDSVTDPLEKSIVKGFVVHPAKIAHSIEVSQDPFLKKQKNSLKEIKDLLEAFRSSSTKEESLALLKTLKKHSEIQDLSKKIKEAEQLSNGFQGIKVYLDILKGLNTEIAFLFEEAEFVLQNQKEEERLQGLLYIKAFERLLLGTLAISSNSLGQYSLRDVSAILEDISTLTQYQKSLPFPSQCVDLLLDGNLGSFEAFVHWKAFLLSLEPVIQQKELKQLKALIGMLRETKSLPLWLSFFQDPNNQKNPLERLKEIFSQIRPSDEIFIRDLLQRSKEIQKMQDQMNLFAGPESFMEASEKLEHLMSSFSSREWLEKLQDGSPVTQMIGYQVMQSLVSLFDEASKTVKSSHSFVDTMYILHFKKLLEKGFFLMKTWATRFVPNERDLSEKLERIGYILSALPDNDSKQLLPSKNFSVAAAMIGSTSYYERHEPKRLDDVFTLIHQNCLSIISICNQSNLNKLLGKLVFVPKELEEVRSKIKETFPGGMWRLLEIGIEVTPNEMVFRYNIPLQSHSGSLDIHYDFLSKEITLKGRFLGESRFRWKEISRWFSVLEKTDLLPPKNVMNETEQELSFSWEITSENTEYALKEYKEAASYSFYGNRSKRLDDFMASRYLFWKDRKELLTIYRFLKESNHLYTPFFEKSMIQNPPVDQEISSLVFRVFTKSAIEDMKKKDVEFQEEMFKLFQGFFGKQQSYQAVEDSMNSNDLEVQKVILDFLQRTIQEMKGDFFENRMYVSNAKKAVNVGLCSWDSKVRRKSGKLLEILVEKKYASPMDYDYVKHRFYNLFSLN